jgi:hypothetical protein
VAVEIPSTTRAKNLRDRGNLSGALRGRDTGGWTGKGPINMDDANIAVIEGGMITVKFSDGSTFAPIEQNQINRELVKMIVALAKRIAILEKA